MSSRSEPQRPEPVPWPSYQYGDDLAQHPTQGSLELFGWSRAPEDPFSDLHYITTPSNPNQQPEPAASHLAPGFWGTARGFIDLFNTKYYVLHDTPARLELFRRAHALSNHPSTTWFFYIETCIYYIASLQCLRRSKAKEGRLGMFEMEVQRLERRLEGKENGYVEQVPWPEPTEEEEEEEEGKGE